jgi:hypothetical protein
MKLTSVKHYRSSFLTTHPRTHQLIDGLQQIQSETDLKTNSMKNKELNYKRKETVHVRCRLVTGIQPNN